MTWLFLALTCHWLEDHKTSIIGESLRGGCNWHQPLSPCNNNGGENEVPKKHVDVLVFMLVNLFLWERVPCSFNVEDVVIHLILVVFDFHLAVAVVYEWGQSSFSIPTRKKKSKWHDFIWFFFKKNYRGGPNRVRTGDLLICSQMLYHWAMDPRWNEGVEFIWILERSKRNLR